MNSLFGDEVSRRTQGGDQVQYTFQKDNWFVVTGVNAKGFEYYAKSYFFEDSSGRWYISWDFVYPHEQHKLYDPLVATIAKGFIPNLPGQHEHRFDCGLFVPRKHRLFASDNLSRTS